MNHVKLVEMMKVITKEKMLSENNLGRRYGRQIGKKTSNLNLRYKPDIKLAENDKKIVKGPTATGKQVVVDLQPEYNSQMTPATGPTKPTA